MSEGAHVTDQQSIVPQANFVKSSKEMFYHRILPQNVGTAITWENYLYLIDNQ